MFAALDDEEASTLYYSLAFIYALPYLGNGFELDGFALLSLAICILHVQVGGWVGQVGGCGCGRGRAMLCIIVLLHSRGAPSCEQLGLCSASTSTLHPPACLPSHACLQVERLAQTEPVEVELPSVLRRLLAGIPLAVRSLGRYSARLGEEVGGRTRSAEDARKRRPDRCVPASQGCCRWVAVVGVGVPCSSAHVNCAGGYALRSQCLNLCLADSVACLLCLLTCRKYLEERSREARAELESFDKRRREREAEQQRQRKQQEGKEGQEGLRREREKEKER